MFHGASNCRLASNTVPRPGIATPPLCRVRSTSTAGFQLRGSIDLVERRADGHVRVTDHKTGKDVAKEGQVVAGGTSLQPLLYALVAEKLFDQETEVDSGRLYFCTSVGGYAERTVKLDQRARSIAADLAKIVGDAIAGSFLPAAPGENECGWCDYQIVCGPYEELRVLRKPHRELVPLQKLRDMP